MKTLVIILGDTRSHEITFNNFKSHVIDQLNADVCLCIAVKDNYDYENPFYKSSKYNFIYREPEDFGDSFDYAYDTIIKKMDKPNIDTSIHWRDFLKMTNILFGGVKYNDRMIEGGGGIVLFLRWYLLQRLIEHNLICEYDRFIITRSDFIFQLPHPKMEFLDDDFIWFPDDSHYGGYTDRHVILSNKNIEKYLNIFENIVINSNDYYNKIKTTENTNIEKLIKFNLEYQNVSKNIKEFPYIMYLVRSENGQTRWSSGMYSQELGYYIKYPFEYEKSSSIKNRFLESGLDIDIFYANTLNVKKKCIIITTINTPSAQVISYTNQPGWDLIIVGDSKTDDSLYKLLNCIYLGLEEQKAQFPTLFDKIPLKSYTRKMFGYLYAIQKKYDVIYDTDDDNKYMYDLDSYENNIIELPDKNIPYNDIERFYFDYDFNQMEYRMRLYNAKAFTFDKVNKFLYFKDNISEISVNKECISGMKRNSKYCYDKGFVNIYKQYTDENIWPRGIPPGHKSIDIIPEISDTESEKMEVSVIQGLVNNDPDVDAYYRLNIKNTPFSFEKDPEYDIVMGKYSVCPFNTQNTFWTDKTMFYAMYLPVSVSFRYTDILRGFIALYQLWKNNKTIKFTFPTAIQERNEHDLAKDYESEETMYKTAEKVIELLNENKDAGMKEMYEILLKNQIVYETEIDTLNEWMRLIEECP
jgi:hypothetical protein